VYFHLSAFLSPPLFCLSVSISSNDIIPPHSNRKCVADGAKVIDMIDTGDDEAFGGQMDELQAAIKATTSRK
jgi:hypothetical protein